MSISMGLITRTVEIASGASLTPAIALGPHTLVTIGMSAGWDAANLTFQVSLDGTTFLNLYDQLGNEITFGARAGAALYVDPIVFAGATLIKIRSGVAALPVVQSALRTLALQTRVV